MAASSSVKPIIPMLTEQALWRRSILHPSTPTNMFAQYRPNPSDVYAYATWIPTAVFALYWLAQPQDGKWSNSLKEALLHPFTFHPFTDESTTY